MELSAMDLLITLVWMLVGAFGMRPCLRLNRRAKRAWKRERYIEGEPRDYALNRLLISRTLVTMESTILLIGAAVLLVPLRQGVQETDHRTFAGWVVIAAIVFIIGGGIGFVAGIMDQFEAKKLGEVPMRCYVTWTWGLLTQGLRHATRRGLK